MQIINRVNQDIETVIIIKLCIIFKVISQGLTVSLIFEKLFQNNKEQIITTDVIRLKEK
jgi:hypothetical protein